MESDNVQLKRYIQSYWRYFLLLEKRLLETESFVAIDETNSDAYSLEYLTLLQAACGEIDALGKEIATRFLPEEFGTDKNVGITKWGYCVQRIFPNIEEQHVSVLHELDTAPFNNWYYEKKTDKNGKLRYYLAAGKKSLAWWRDYNEVKHHRASIDPSLGFTNFHKATQGNVILAFSGLFILNRYAMRKMDKDAYQTIEQSKMFKLPGDYDEVHTFMIYNSEGLPCQVIDE